MIFNSIEFAIFFPLVFILYWVFFKRNTRLRNIFIIGVSYFFYGYWDWRFLSLIIISSFVDFYLGGKIGATSDSRKRKSLLAASLLINLGFLGFFKYCNFFIDSFVTAFTFFGFQPNVSTLQIILPVGISFYTFQTLSYTIDIYRKELNPTRDIFSFFAFVCFFPQLVAGPIERAKHLLPQFNEKPTLDYEKLRSGALLIASGLFKKIVIADRLAIYINNAYGDVNNISGLPATMAVVFFAFQLYFDFSAYSEIAIGTAKMLDFQLSDNFRRPYLSKSFSDFWKRWHISLSSWFKDYLYIPLGGNRKGNWLAWRNILIVFVLSGLWHGASWNFVVWGTLNALFLIFFDLVLKKLNPTGPQRIISAIVVFSCWALSLILFRGQTFSDAITMFGNLGFGNLLELYDYGLSAREFKFMIGLLALILLIEIAEERWPLYAWFAKRPALIRWAYYLIISISILLFGAYGEGGDNVFIYFQF